MSSNDRIKFSLRKNPLRRNYVERHEFTCLEVNIPVGGNWMKRVFCRAEQIVPKLNAGQANSSEKREMSIVEIDNLSGIIAEAACQEVLEWRYGKGSVIKPRNDTSYNQIDLELYNEKTIEVRSSCVRNGIDFALFARNKENPDEQYFDVIGPYSNGYKKGEDYKDYYMRVLYVCDKKNFMDLFEEPMLRLYITGGATESMMVDSDYYQLKHLTPAGGQVKVESDYQVIPLAKSLDIKEFFAVLEEENDRMTVVHP